MLRKEGEIVEEQMRPNLSAAKTTQFDDWFSFVKDFGAKDVTKLKTQPSFLEEIIWEKDYQPVDWKRVPYRKTITEFLRPIEELVLVPVNLGAFATIKEAKRLLQPGGRFISFDAGTPFHTPRSTSSVRVIHRRNRFNRLHALPADGRGKK